MNFFLYLSLLISFNAFAGHYNSNQTMRLDCKDAAQNCMVLSPYTHPGDNESTLNVLYVRSKASLFVSPSSSPSLENAKDFMVDANGEISMKLKPGETVVLGEATLPASMKSGDYYAVEWSLSDRIKTSSRVKKTTTTSCQRTALGLNEKITWENIIYELTFTTDTGTVVNMNSNDPRMLSSHISLCRPK